MRFILPLIKFSSNILVKERNEFKLSQTCGEIYKDFHCYAEDK